MKRPQGRPPVNTPRPSIVKRSYRGKTIFAAQIRGAKASRIYLSAFDTHQEALTACLRYLATGEKPPRRTSSKRKPYSPRKSNAKPAPQIAVTKKQLTQADRMKLMRQIWSRIA